MPGPVPPNSHDEPAAAKSTPGTGVSYVEAGEGDAGQRIDNFLSRILKDVPRSLIYRILRTGEVRVNGTRAKPETRLAEGDRIRCARPLGKRASVIAICTSRLPK